MTERILVRGEVSHWVHAGRVFGAVVLLAGIVLGAAVGPWGWLVAVGGTALWAVLEFVAWQARRIRTWLTLHPDGIEVESPAGHRAIHDSQISAVALETKKNLSNGELSSVTRKFTLWAEDVPDPVRMENKIKIGKVDPLAGLIERLLNRLCEQMSRDLARGGTASGDGWHLSRTALTLGRPPDDQQLPLTDIVAVEAFDGQMCVWRRGSDAAVAKLPLSSRNVHLLPGLVQPYLPQDATSVVASNAAAGRLGRVLFERRAHRSTVIAVSIAGVMMTAVGIGLLVALRGRANADDGAYVAAVVLTVLGPGLAFVGWWLALCCFRCHERGVWKSTPLGQQTLFYHDVGSFQYSAVRHYHNGAYTGTQLTMKFRPVSPDGGSSLRYSTRTRGDDEALDELRDFISRQLAARMAEQVRAGQPVTWTNNLQFLPGGISYRASGLLGRKEPQLLPYESYGGYDLKQGMFYLFAKDNKKYVASEHAAADNFYPGFFLLMMLLHQPAEEQAAT